MDQPISKACRMCGVVKPLDEFHINKTTKDGRQGSCKDCATARARKWNADHPERKLASSRRWWRQHSTEHNIQRTERRAADPEKYRDQHRASYARNKDAARERMRRYRETPRAKELERLRYERYRTEGRFAAYSRRKAYRLEPAEYEALVAAQDGRCAICGREARLDVDHDHKTGGVRALLCGHCNKGIGHMKDDPTLLRAAADYLERFSSS